MGSGIGSDRSGLGGGYDDTTGTGTGSRYDNSSSGLGSGYGNDRSTAGIGGGEYDSRGGQSGLRRAEGAVDDLVHGGEHHTETANKLDPNV